MSAKRKPSNYTGTCQLCLDYNVPKAELLYDERARTYACSDCRNRPVEHFGPTEADADHIPSGSGVYVAEQTN